jgi:hypothetical protein
VVTLTGDTDWNSVVRTCEASGLSGEDLYAEILRTVTKPRVRGPLPARPPVREGPPAERVRGPLSEPEFVLRPGANGGSEVWQIVRYDEPNMDLVPAKIYLNGFRLVWTDAGMPSELPDGSLVPANTEDVVILHGPTVFGGVFVCVGGQHDQTAWVRHDQLLIKPGDADAERCLRGDVRE